MQKTHLLFALLLGCSRYAPVQLHHQQLTTSISAVEMDEWAMECAPKELALAHSHKKFAELEFLQGDLHRAEDHLRISKENIEAAQLLAEACVPQDQDGDGLVDGEDECPEEPELVNGYKDEDGCPESDSDGDGVFDEVDRCPSVAEDMDGFQDGDGCPDNDNDKDGFVDSEDSCPNEAEDYDAFQDDDGCPEETEDLDGDGIFDDVDRCINKPENWNSYLDEDGCPDQAPKNVRITDNQIVIEDKILFQSGKAVILRQSYEILGSVGQVLRDYEDIRVSIDGHTDSDGSSSYNLKLSKKRAAAVRSHLIKREQIDGDRLESQGYGESSPLADNGSKDGKEKNRRVEFVIIKEEE
jgi:OmpA-OmpF porin, OOP family